MQQTTKLPFQGFPLFPIIKWVQSSNAPGAKNIKKSSCLKQLGLEPWYYVCSIILQASTTLWRPKMAPPQMSHVLFVEVLHPVNFVNISLVCWSIKIHSWSLRGAMLSYTFINSHSQVSSPGPSCLYFSPRKCVLLMVITLFWGV